MGTPAVTAAGAPVRRPCSRSTQLISSTLTCAVVVVQSPWIRMPPATDSPESLLFQLRCQASGCLQIFFLCRRCFRGQRYCSPPCRAMARKLQHRRASAHYQQSPEGRLGHCDCQRNYRQRLRSRAAPAAAPVTDPSSLVSVFQSSFGSEHTRSAPHPQLQPPRRVFRPPLPDSAPGRLSCWACGRLGYLRK